MPEVERNRFVRDGWVLEPFIPDALAHGFDCGDNDLNDFFNRDLVPHEKQLLTKSYVLTPDEATVKDGNPAVAFISFCNDVIRKPDSSEIDDEQADLPRRIWNRILRKIPNRKRYNTLPAVKIARLGVQISFRGKGVGTALLNMTKRFFLTSNRTGCRFLTVDAYSNEQAINFYKKNHFDFLTETDASEETRAMYYDLIRTRMDAQ